ncbi:TonB-dependent receptor [Alloacidobacterium dinghuense]|uniref:TonB-dependent receptor n=1 Tax=Alloacidobacterium dinghuense TaxID=2763107 RepID=A0A7G8BIH9_9BACT|nr:TonB-dependent receptor [Alloacidobacterium dinghuense]QNI32349.1 TonB-dependent receptor [Alloacidobacterium dinghuense]
MTKRHAFCVLLLVLSLTSLTFAQTATTSLRGTIKDPSGAVVPGARITLTDNSTGKLLQTTSTSGGDYQFNQIPPATYTIKVSVTGFGDQSKVAELLVNQPATVDFALSVQASAEVINVTAEAQTLNTTDATLGNSVTNATIQALPSEGRNVPELLALQPGVLFLGHDNDQTTDSRSGAVNGGRSDQGNVTLDGLDDNDQVNGFAFTGVLRETLDSVEEFRVTTSNSNADAGRSSGAQVSLVTKTGTNKFHGSAYEYHRPTFTVANDWFNKQAQLASGEPNIPGKLIRNTFGAAVGGPIIKDKLFFFGNYEGQRTAENIQVTQTVPTASYRAGNLTYVANSNPVTLTPAQLGQLDDCSGPNVCPWGAGPDPYAEQYFQQFPLNNGFSQGDGYNYGSYTFSSPAPATLNTSIAKIDWVPNEKQRVFFRGNLQKDTTTGTEQFPGQPAQSFTDDNSKGFAIGDTWMISSNLVNDIRYGYTRQGYSNRGVGQGDYVDFRFMSTLTAETRSTVVDVPVNNIVDNLSWTKGNHSVQFGGNWRLIHNNRGSDQNSYNNASTNPYWLGNFPPTPDNIGLPAVDGGFGNSYEIAYDNLIGAVPSLTQQSNYQVTNGGASGNLFPDGTFINRHFKANEFEYYVQDAWRIRPNFTLTFGLRHTILQTPYETSGQQIAPTIDTHDWFMQRGVAAAAGQAYEQDLTFAPNGPVYHQPGYWQKSKNNIAPRLAFAWAPDSKTSIRGGFGIFYDHYGESIVNSFDQLGSFGLTTSLTNPAGTQFTSTSPRFTGRSTLPSIPLPPASNPISYPYLVPSNSFLITWGVDDKLKTPYSESIDFSVQRELPGGFTVDFAYVGRMGRHLLQQLDLAEPVDLVDTKSGIDYFTAGSQLSKIVDQNDGNGPYSGNNTNVNVPAIPYFEDVFSYMAGFDYTGESATQAIYNNEWAPNRYGAGETTALADIDYFCYNARLQKPYNCPTNAAGNPMTRFWQDQFSSLYAWSSIGMSYYNAGQIVLRHPLSHGLQFDFSYTYSRSIDMGSDTERASELYVGGNGAGSGTSAFSTILNSWKPYLNRGVSDFDTTHLITVDWVYLLPFGRGQHFAGNVNGVVNAFIGGWQWSGLNRWTTGLPFTILAPGWATNWQIESAGVVTGNVKLRKHLDSNGEPQVFDDPDAINSGVSSGGSPVRLPYPGEAGERNNFRGDGIFNIDSGLSKTWKITEGQNIKFAWEVFNVTNSVRFDTNPSFLNSSITSGTLGVYSATLSGPRKMQFSLRYSF